MTFCQALMPEIKEEVVCQYRAGWPKATEDLLALYADSYQKESHLGHSQYPTHYHQHFGLVNPYFKSRDHQSLDD
jgi:DNA replication and repair protein RecF